MRTRCNHRSARRRAGPRNKLPGQVILIRIKANFFTRINRASFTIVLFNLIGNAMKAVHDTQAPSIRVSVDHFKDKDVLQIKETDNGFSITTDERKQIFNGRCSGLARRAGLGNPKSTGVGLLGVRLIERTQF